MDEQRFQDAEQFLLTVLQLVSKSQGNAQQVYPFLNQHQDRLDETLLQILPPIATTLLADNPKHQKAIAIDLVDFGNLIQQFPLGQRWLNLELGIAAYQQALTVQTQGDMPIEWADTIYNLALAYFHRIRGDRAENIGRAIKYYQDTLTVTTQSAMPIEWADTVHNIAVAYITCVWGDPAENIEAAIAYYRQALTVRTRDTLPIKWAQTIHNLANAYSKRIRGNRAENIEQAIEYYQQVLTVRTQSTMPTEWADTMNDLANAYSERIWGDKAENLELAIVGFQKALIVHTQRDMPVKWAQTITNLAATYRNRIRGDRAQSIEQAINCLQQALTVRMQDSMPIEWAETMHNLANAYSVRIRGDRAQNLEQSINYYQQALSIMQTDMPVEWAQGIHNLANAYHKRIEGNRSENLEQAINYYQQALIVWAQRNMPIEWARTIDNLANVYSERVKGNPAENIEQAIEYYQKSLTVRTFKDLPIQWADTIHNLAATYRNRIRGDQAENIEQSISYYQQALTVTTEKDMPVEWAETMMNLAIAYYSRIRGNPAENIEQAVFACQSSLKIYSPELFPNDCRRAAQALAKLYTGQDRWVEAIPVYQRALQAAELLYQSADLLSSKLAELSETADIPRRAAYTFARTGQLEQAVLTLEQGRARGLSETLNRDRTNLIELQQSYPELFTQYQDITQQLRNLEAQQRERMTSEERHSVTPEVFRTAAQRLRQTLTETIEQIRQEGYTDFLAQANFADIQQAVRPEVPLVYLVATPNGSLALMVTTDEIHSVWLDKLTDERLIDMLRIWLQIYGKQLTAWQNYQKEPSAENRQVHQQAEQAWFEASDQATHQLWQLLMAPLIDHLKQHNFQQATLIPTGYLSLLPLHAAWVDDSTKLTGRRYALDEICFTYAPNARSINAAQEIAQRIETDSILAIDNPLKDLRNSDREVTAAVANFHQPQILKHEQATIESVLNALSQCNILHLSCHGTADLREPLNSGLSMSDGLLTLRDLLNLRLSEQGGIRLAVLSACETGLAGTSLPDEAISLPTGLLQAGVAGVVASLWSVSDLSTMLLLVRFYDLWRKEGLAPAVALQRAQQWLRDSTEAELADYFGWLPRSPEARTYAHPYHWAAFSYTGV